MAEFPPIKERIVPPAIKAQMRMIGGNQMAGSMRHFRMGEVKIVTTREDHGPPLGPPDMRHHVSLSTTYRLPTWSEIKHVQNELHPGVFFCIPMPPKEYWFSLHEYAMHIEEVKDQNSIEQWKAQADGRAH